jgi:large subunit ribosomal protein L29
MTKQKIDFKELSEQDLKSQLTDEEQRLKKLKFSHTISPVENPMILRGIRRNIARLKTELRKRELGF